MILNPLEIAILADIRHLGEDLFEGRQLFFAIGNDQSGWRSVFGLADPKSVAEVDEVIEREFEQVNPAEWR